MKKTLLLATALALVITGSAAPLDTKGIPADAQGLVHIDMDLCAKSVFGIAMARLAARTPAGPPDAAAPSEYEQFKKQTGINPETDIRSVTIGLLKPAADARTPDAIAILRGAFSPAKIIAAARENKCAVTTEGALTLINVSSLSSDGENGTDKKQAVFAGLVGSDTALFSESAGGIRTAAAALSGNKKSYAPPAALAAAAGGKTPPMIVAYFDAALAGDAAAGMPLSKAANALITIIEKGSNLQMRIYSEYTSPEAARKTQAAVQMMIGFLQMGAAGSGAPDAEANAQSLQRLIDSLKMTQNGKTLEIAAEYPVADMVAWMEKYMVQE